MRTDLSKYDISWYKPGNKLFILLWYFVNIIFFQNKLLPFYSIKIFLLKFFGAEVGNGVVIKPGVNIKYPWKLKIGDHVWIGEDVWIDNLDYVYIGNNVCISQGAMLLCGNHHYKKTTFDLIIGEITIEDGVWIAARSIVTNNITCKEHSILLTNSVATNNLDAYTIYRGNPAISIKKRK